MGRHEQPPKAWWNATRMALGQLNGKLRARKVAASQLAAISADATSGTIVPLDRAGNPQMPAMMYNDYRAVDQVALLNAMGKEHCEQMGYTFTADFALAKIIWFKETYPEKYEESVFAHQGDYILGLLKGKIDTTDYSSALKSGCDLIDEIWPDWLDYDMHLAVREHFMKLVPPGTLIGKVTRAASEATGLPAGLPVVSGATDGTAGFISSGARRPGDFNTSLGTTLIFKAISSKICRHGPAGIYSHKLPDGRWLPGASSNTGAEWVNQWFSEKDPAAMDTQVADLLPTSYMAYPMVRKGERFPFISNSAEGFISPATDNRKVQYAACLQGTAMLEKLSYQIFDKMMGTFGGEVYTTGKGSASDAWTQIRADVNERVYHRPISIKASFGAAMLAGMGVQFDSLAEASDAMVRLERSFEPNHERTIIYREYFEQFRESMEEQGYL
jgi:xylulokinase